MKRKDGSDNVVSLRDRLERWSTSYTSSCSRLQIHTSNHGRTKLCVEGTVVVLDFIEGVRLLSQMSEGMENVANEL